MPVLGVGLVRGLKNIFIFLGSVSRGVCLFLLLVFLGGGVKRIFIFLVPGLLGVCSCLTGAWSEGEKIFLCSSRRLGGAVARYCGRLGERGRKYFYFPRVGFVGLPCWGSILGRSGVILTYSRGNMCAGLLVAFPWIPAVLYVACLRDW